MDAVGGGGPPPSQVRVKLKLFGGFKMSQPNDEAFPVIGKRERVLLAYLALSPNCRQPRNKLATILWGDADDETLLDNLRTCVWSARKALNDADHKLIVSDDDAILLDARAFDVDVWAFRHLSGQPARDAQEKAASLYTGEFLDGLNIDSAEFQAWVRDEAARFRNLAIDVFDRVAVRYAEAGDTERAIDACQSALRLDPLHEKTARRLMRMYAETGRRGAAFQLFRTLSEKLKSDLGAEPEADTRRLFEEISRGVTPIDGTRPVSVPGPTIPSGTSESAPTRAAMEPVPPKAEPRARWSGFAYAALAGAVAVMAIGAAVLYIPGKSNAPLDQPKLAFALPKKPSIAVLPFENISGDKAQDGLSDALTNDITTALSIVSEMFVIDGASAHIFRDTSTRDTQVAEDLGVRYLLRGSVQRSDTRVRVSARLVDALSGKQIWADLYDREIKDTFEVQDEIALAILTALEIQLTEGEQQRMMLVHGTQNLQAWVIAGQGLLALRHLTPEDNARARELYGQAVALDPNYPSALDGLAWSYLLAARFGWSDQPAADLAMAAGLGQKLLALDPQYSRTYALLGIIRLMMNDHAGAKTFGEKAVALDPNGSEVAALLGLSLTYTNDMARSPDLISEAMRLSPYYPAWYRWALGRSYRLVGRYREAEAALAPRQYGGPLPVPHLVELTATYIEEGKEAEARATAKDILAIAPQFSIAAWTEHPLHQDSAVNDRERELLSRAGLPN